MADTKISGLTALTGANVDTAADLLAIVDTSASATKKITVDELRNALVKAQTLTDGATISWDTSLGVVASVTLAGNRTMAAPTNLAVGTYILYVNQDATGSRTLTWNAVFKWQSATAPTLSTGASKVDIFSFISDGTNLYGNAMLDVR